MPNLLFCIGLNQLTNNVLVDACNFYSLISLHSGTPFTTMFFAAGKMVYRTGEHRTAYICRRVYERR